MKVYLDHEHIHLWITYFCEKWCTDYIEGVTRSFMTSKAHAIYNRLYFLQISIDRLNFV